MKLRALPGAISGVTLFLAGCLPAPATALPVSPTAAESIAAFTLAPTPTVAPLSTGDQLIAPTASPVPLVTAPPAVLPTGGAATPDPNLGVGPILFQDPLDGSSSYDWAYESSSSLFTILGGQLNAVMKQGDVGPRLRMGPALMIDDQLVRVTARANLCYERDEYGLIFRAQNSTADSADGYVFKLNCAGQARVDQLRGGQSNLTLVEWTSSAAIAAGAPAENVFMVWAAGRQFHFYINDRYLFSAADSSYPAGRYGFYVRDRTQGGESVSFSDLIARQVIP